MLQISLGTVKGRHIMPVTEYIIENEIEDVTGLTVVTLAVVKSCKKYGCNLVCLHYDRESDTYIGQKVFE